MTSDSAKIQQQERRGCEITPTVVNTAAGATEHLPIARYYRPEEFAELVEIGLGLGFEHVEAGPLVRSSYHAKRQVDALSGRRPGDA